MLNPGTVLDGRYEIVEVVGSGGMSIVYKAKDYRLKRFVAIKVLKSDFSNDSNFVSKFRNEAESSAGLTHPNIVSVYDVSEDNGLYFIVMELVEGITLKEYIRLNGRLSMDQAIDFSIQIASGLEAAHENHVIHRDIKPQNIIVAKNGVLKVTDFGIAKAATSNTMSTTGMGSVHYISPEQARGGYSDERSDIYSLGITMYEMITGRVPFEGDTNVSIALMHIQNEIIPPRQYFPDIYTSFEKIVLKATQKKPERRYITANALIADLRRVKNNPNIDIIVAPNHVTNAPTQQFTQEDMRKIKDESQYKQTDDISVSQNAAVAAAGAAGAANPGTGARRTSQPVVNDGRINQMIKDAAEDDYDFDDEEEEEIQPKPKKGIKVVDDDEDEDEDVRPRKRRKYTDDDEDEDDPEDAASGMEKAVMIAGVAAAIIITLIVLAVFGRMMGWFKFGSTTEAPSTASTDEVVATDTEVQKLPMVDVVGTSKEAAEKILKDKGFSNYTFVVEKNEDVPANYVISQSIEKNTEILPDDEIVVYVSGGAETIVIPDLTNYSVSDADKALEDLGFKVTHSYQPSDTIEKDKVISTDPGYGSECAKGNKIIIVVSNGPDIKEVAVPLVTGISESAAISSLEAVNLVVGEVTHEYSDTVEAGVVIRQGISNGTTVNEGTSVSLVVSDGKKEIKYSGSVTGTINLVDETAIDAVNAVSSVLVEVYLTVGDNTYTIYAQSVTGATSFPLSISGSQADLTVGTGSVSYKLSDPDGNDMTGNFKGDLSSTFSQQ